MKKISKKIASRFALIFMVVQIFCSVSVINVSALGDKPEGVEMKVYTFEDYCEAKFQFPADPTTLKTSDSELGKLLYYNLKSTQEYVKWYRSAIKAVQTTSASSEDNVKSVTFKAMPAGIDASNTKVSESELSRAWASYNSVATTFNGIAARAGSNQLVEDIYDTDAWDPTNAVVLGALSSFQNFCNSAFIILARVMFYAFLAQLGADALYMTVDFFQPILAPANSGASTGSGNGTVKLPDWFPKFNVVSGEAIEAANKGSSGTSTSGGGLFQSNTLLKYIVLRAPRILLAAAYLVLTTTGMWPRLVAALSSVLARALGTIV